MGRGMYKRKLQRQLENKRESKTGVLTSTTAEPLFKVKINHPSLRMRCAPSMDAEEIGLITNQGEYDIFETNGEWGCLNNNAWIMLTYTSKIKNS